MQIIYTSGNYKRTIVKSIVAIVLGLVLVLWPTEVLNYTVKIIGAVFCVTGIISFLVSMRDQDERSARGLTSFNGIGSIVLGILLWSMADFFTNLFNRFLSHGRTCHNLFCRCCIISDTFIQFMRSFRNPLS